MLCYFTEGCHYRLYVDYYFSTALTEKHLNVGFIVFVERDFFRYNQRIIYNIALNRTFLTFIIMCKVLFKSTLSG